MPPVKPVRLLEARVVDQIAAGEVVERPASVVKELVENALDAGSRAIDVVLKEGGRALVRVSDDGSGMDREDAMLAIERHATSKIWNVEDLQGVTTLGFRGEALPSIAAVSRFELLTRTEGGQGTRIRIDAGTLQDVREAGAARGTVVDVRALFHTLPPRRAFLRTAATEASHCVEVVTRLALGRPEVAFTLRNEDRIGLRTGATTDLAARAADLLGSDAGKLIPIDVTSPSGLRLVGLASTGAVHRGSIGTAAYLYVDGRWVRDTLLRRAIAHAYKGLVPEGRHPLVVLDLRLPYGSADVNVHPTKAEVRFRDPSGVAAFVGERLRSAVRTDVRRPAPLAAMTTLPLEPPRMPALPPELPIRTTVPPLAAEPGAPYVATTPNPLPSPQPAPDANPPTSGQPTPGPTPSPQTTPNQPPQPAPPPVIGIARGRFLVLDDGDGLAVVDGGRLAWRVATAGALGEPRRLMVPRRVVMSEAGMAALVAAEEALWALGLSFARFSATEVVVRTVPDALRDADPADVLRIAAQAPDDLSSAWAEGLPPLDVLPDGLLERAAAFGIPPGPVIGRVVLP